MAQKKRYKLPFHYTLYYFISASIRLDGFTLLEEIYIHMETTYTFHVDSIPYIKQWWVLDDYSLTVQ